MASDMMEKEAPPPPDSIWGMEALTFNVRDGFVDAIVRGYRSGLLSTSDYNNLSQCDSMDDIKMHLGSTDYSSILSNVPSPVATSTLVHVTTKKLVEEFQYLKAHAEEPLTTFLDYCCYGYMIDNVILIVTGTLHERDVSELLEKCHPLGLFDSLASLAVANSMQELYRIVLIDTPLGKYFEQSNLSSEDLDEMNIEIMRNTLYRAYIEDFHRYCCSMGGATAMLMNEILTFEADKRSVIITLNSIGTELTRDDRRKLYPQFGSLYPYGHAELSICDDFDSIRSIVEKFPTIAPVFAKLNNSTSSNSGNNSSSNSVGGEAQLLDKLFYEEEVKSCMLSFEQQFHYAVFFAYLRLREQEVRNLLWISECVAQNQKNRITDGIVFTF